MNQSNSELGGIAVIGMACRFPGASNTEQFWQNLASGKDSVSRPSKLELMRHGVPQPILEASNHVAAAGRLTEIEYFDANFFEFSGREAAITDPQQRMLLELGQEVLDHGGYGETTATNRTGVYVGVGPNTYLLTQLFQNAKLVSSVGLDRLLLANDKAFASTRLSYKLNFQGPSFTVDCACSSSLVAVHQACSALLLHECNMAVAGGVRVIIPHHSCEIFEEGGILAADGYCRAFDKSAGGTVVGSGGGLVLLKRLGDAIEDRDTIHAVIRGSCVNNDGSCKVGFTAPSVTGQARTIREAMLIAGVDPREIEYVESHGTGTILGDPVEIAGLKEAFQSSTRNGQYCAIGSVKTNIGHLDAAAGIAGLIKVVMTLKNRIIPPSLHFKEANPAIDFASGPFYVNTSSRPWNAEARKRYASISSFGMGGTNAHMVLEEYSVVDHFRHSRKWQMLPLSAKTKSALNAASTNLMEYLNKQPTANLADVAYTLKVGRKNFQYRRFVSGCSVEQLILGLQSSAGQKECASTDHKPVLAYMFPGQGSQYAKMFAGLYVDEALFRNVVDQCLELLTVSLRDEVKGMLGLHRNRASKMSYDNPRVSHPALFIVEYSLARLLQHWGIFPQCLIGHSLGEYVAACLSGIFSIQEGLQIVSIRAELVSGLPLGRMLAVALSGSEVSEFLDTGCSIAALNGPSQCVVSGPLNAIERLQSKLSGKGIATRRLRSTHAFHSTMVDPILSEFEKALRRISLDAPRIPIVSSVTGKWIRGTEIKNPDYWVRHLRDPVRFADGVRTLLGNGRSILAEIGPSQNLVQIVRRIGNELAYLIPCGTSPCQSMTDSECLTQALGNFFLAGVDVDWMNYYKLEERFRIPLPSYPFERQKFWVEAVGRSEMPILAKEKSENKVLTQPALPNVNRESRKLHGSIIIPSNQTEVALKSIWESLLGFGNIGVGDNFFSLGGDSLLAAQVATAIRSQESVDISAGDVLQCSTIAALATKIDQLRINCGSKSCGLNEEDRVSGSI